MTKTIKRILCNLLTICLVLTMFPSFSVAAEDRTSFGLGDYIQMGTYYGEPILWRCVHIDENGPLMLSDKIICFKPFDVIGSNLVGSHGRSNNPNGFDHYKRPACGSNYWGDSNLRCWLNSNATDYYGAMKSLFRRIGNQ